MSGREIPADINPITGKEWPKPSSTPLQDMTEEEKEVGDGKFPGMQKNEIGN